MRKINSIQKWIPIEKILEKGIIKLNPDYQRNHRWNDSESSRLMESLILNIPIPTVYLSQDVDVDDRFIRSACSSKSKLNDEVIPTIQ